MVPKNTRSLRLYAKQRDREPQGQSSQFFSFLKVPLGSLVYHNPKLHQEYQPMSDLEALVNLIKCTFGTGILAMPRAYYNAGWLLGLISTVLVAGIVVYSLHIYDINKLCKRYKMKMLSYSEAMQLAILNGPVWARPLNKYFSRQVDIFLCIYHFGVDCVYVVFMGKNIKKLADIYFKPVDTRIYMALITVPLILTFLIRDLKYLVPFSIISNVLMLISFGLILSYFLNDLPSLSERTAIQSLSKYPLFFGTILFSIEAVGVILALQLHMTTPENYLGTFGVLNRAMIIVVIFYASFGFLGYWQFGDETSSSIINNLPADETVPQCIIALFTIAIFFSYALQGYVTIEIIWRSYMTPRLMANATKSVEYLLRMAMVVASVLCAISYPDFGLLLSFVGSFCLAQLGFIYPALINIFVCYSEGYGPCKIFLLRSLFFIFIGLCGGIAGTMISVAAIKEKYDNRILFFLSAFHITT
ncbi:proton-coupled amino acid transporter-like protein CG1139 isoform X2 [Drosophila montana]|uniref:proton-coupled amino acid transporter-like protein CG1139 isoform X2 n=1 Tax=Drosophila montana TaxID=40370 RepID=UPI00313CD6B2